MSAARACRDPGAARRGRRRRAARGPADAPRGGAPPRARGAAGLLVAAGLAGAAAVLLVAALLSRAPEPRGAARGRADHRRDLPATPKPAFEIGAPVKLARHDDETTWAAVRRDVVARARPSRSAPRVGRLLARTPEDTTNIVLPFTRRRAGGALWVRMRLPALPNGTLGWVPRSALGAMGRSARG